MTSDECANVWCGRTDTLHWRFTDDPTKLRRAIRLCSHDYERVVVHGVIPTVDYNRVILPEE